MALSLEPKLFAKNAKWMGRNARYMGKNWKRSLENMGGYDVDDFLSVFGLQRQPRAISRFLGGMGLVMGGVVFGVAMGMLMSPRRSEMMRQMGLQPHQRAHHQPGSESGLRQRPL